MEGAKPVENQNHPHQNDIEVVRIKKGSQIGGIQVRETCSLGAPNPGRRRSPAELAAEARKRNEGSVHRICPVARLVGGACAGSTPEGISHVTPENHQQIRRWD